MPDSPTEPPLAELVLKDGELRCSKCGGTALLYVELQPYYRPVLGLKNGTIFISDMGEHWDPDESQDCIDCGQCQTKHRVPSRDKYEFEWDKEAWEEAMEPEQITDSCSTTIDVRHGKSSCNG